MYAWSEEALEINEFWSHSWQAALWMKYLNLLLLYHAFPACLVSMLAALLAAGVFMSGALPPVGNFCMYVGIAVYWLTLLVFRRQTRVFLDIACIDQQDSKLKFEGLVSMGAVLKRSQSMLVLWDSTYVKRLWLCPSLADSFFKLGIGSVSY